MLKSLVRRVLPSRLKPHRIVAGPLRGARIVTSWHDYPASILGRTERDLLIWFDAHVKPGETWLDVGAHYGYTAIALSRLVGSSGRVFAFEPVIATAGCAAQTRTLNRLAQATVVPCGLGAPENLTFTTLPLERGMADRTIRPAPERPSESIQVARFDWLWPLINGGRDAIDGVKIDVQGMEIEALRGMEGLLRRQHPTMVIELHTGVDRPTVLDLLSRAGYPDQGIPVGPPTAGQLADDHSYAFIASNAATRQARQ